MGPHDAAADDKAIILSMDEFRYRYPGQDGLALDRVSFTAERGEFLGIVGGNGAGKSTLCYALVGLVPHFYKGAVGGRVTAAGLDVLTSDVAAVSRRVGLVFQNPFTQITGAKLTVYDEVAFGLEHGGIDRDEMTSRIDDALQRLGLWPLRERSPYALSGGQMQRLAIASVLAMQPDVLVLDEPTSQLDPEGTREVFDVIESLCDGGMTVVMAEHKVDWLAERTDRIIALEKGRIADQGTPRDVFSRFVDNNRRVRSETVPVPVVTDVSAALHWRLREGGYPVTAEETVSLGRQRLSSSRKGRGVSDPADIPAAKRTGSAPAFHTVEPIISVDDIHFHYTAGTPVLKGISVDVGPGTTAIVGQNGAGKSTFVRMLNGLLKPVRGRATIRGNDTAATTVAALARTVGLVFQNPSDQLFKSRVLDEVMFGPLNIGVPREEAEHRAKAVLARLGLDEAIGRNPYDLGLADRKLVTVAGVLAMHTDVVILDEPTIAQDRIGVLRLGRLVEQLKAEGRTVITITHDMDFVARHFDRVLVFCDGRVTADGTAADVFQQTDVLAEAALEAPAIARIARRLGLDDTVLTADDFIRRCTTRS